MSASRLRHPSSGCPETNETCRLKDEKKKWLSLSKPPQDIPPLFPEDQDPSKAPLPDQSLLDADEAEMLQSLTGKSSSLTIYQKQMQSRLQSAQSGLEFKIDQLAGSVHELDQRVATAGREADRVLKLAASRLKEREEREKRSAGTKDLPVMEVLRSLGKILPEGSSGGY